MPPIESDALNALNTLVDDLLDGISPAPGVVVIVQQIKPTGLGGFIAVHPDPQADIYGRQVSALIEVEVRGQQDRVTQVNQALLGLTSQERRQHRILKLELTESRLSEERVLQYAITFEYLQTPTEVGDIIREIPIDLQLGEEDAG
jgi:hypothetical protein